MASYYNYIQTVTAQKMNNQLLVASNIISLFNCCSAVLVEQFCAVYPQVDLQ